MQRYVAGKNEWFYLAKNNVNNYSFVCSYFSLAMRSTQQNRRYELAKER